MTSSYNVPKTSFISKKSMDATVKKVLSEMAGDEGPSEAELAMQRRRQAPAGGDDDDAKALLEENRKLRDEMEKEINELRERSERRKKEREEEEKRLAAERAAEEERRKAEEEERRSKKSEEEEKRRQERAEKMALMEKFKSAPRPNFIITKKSGGGPGGDELGGEEEGKEKKSKEQLEAEKRAILEQRIKPLDIDGADSGKLTERAKELHKDIYRLESEKYDLEKRFKEQQYDMMELAERARQMNKVGKGGLKRIQLGPDEQDPIQEKYSFAPAKIEMYSKYERQKDKRAYGERQTLFSGPVYGFPAERITPWRVIKWDENTGLPSYEEIPGAERPAEEAGEGEEEEE